MSKYDFKTLDMSSNSTSGILLKKIAPYSTVLEFGCATGRMTRYMKEVLHCKVYIVEIEQSAFDHAICYADNGVCDDILNLAWVEKFSAIQFDAVIFADVLEHLSKPELAIRYAAGLLKPHGKMFVSIPNITHNDIIAKAYENQFNYTALGLLDDTHIHFWGLENLVSLADMAKPNTLFLHQIEATYCPTGLTEQYSSSVLNMPQIFVNLLKDRLCGEVYQFVITLGKHPVDDGSEIVQIRHKKIDCALYIDDGKGFREENSIIIKAERTGSCRYTVHYVLNDLSEVRAIRFDPVEGQRCIIQNIMARQAGSELTPNFASAHHTIGSYVYLYDYDPLIIFNPLPDAGSIVLDIDFLLMGENYIDILDKSLHSAIEECSKLQEECSKLQVEVEKLRKESELHALEKTQLQHILEKTTKYNSELLEMNHSLAQKCDLLAEEFDELILKGNFPKE